MPAMHVFEYAVLRVVPCVEREEFMNVGVIVCCRALGFLGKQIYALPEARLRAFAGDTIDTAELTERLDKPLRLFAGAKPHGGTIGTLPIMERFRWLTATRSTVVQTSAVHPGLCR